MGGGLRFIRSITLNQEIRKQRDGSIASPLTKRKQENRSPASRWGDIFEKHKVENRMDYSKCILLLDASWTIHLGSG